MKDTILLSIHPLYVKKILAGEKRFELRRKIPLTIKQIVIYATAPESCIMAIADIEEIIMDSPESLWPQICDASGIGIDFFNNYFAGRSMAYALRLGRVRLLEEKTELSHPKLMMTPPQSFRYLNEDHLTWLSNRARPIAL